MDHKTDEYWGILLWEVAQDAHDDDDLVTAELLTDAAMRYFDGSDRLPTRWQKFQARLEDEVRREPGGRGLHRAA